MFRHSGYIEALVLLSRILDTENVPHDLTSKANVAAVVSLKLSRLQVDFYTSPICNCVIYKVKIRHYRSVL